MGNIVDLTTFSRKSPMGMAFFDSIENTMD